MKVRLLVQHHPLWLHVYARSQFLRVPSQIVPGSDPNVIACLVNPEILILDEVLSVGDGAFRKKSEKMMEILNSGVTTILVSHSIDQIRRMCNKVMWMDKGKQVAFGETKELCDRYEEFLAKKK